MATLYSMEAGVDGWVTLTLIPPVTHLQCTVWVLSLFSYEASCRWYRLHGPRPPDEPHGQFQSDDGADSTATKNKSLFSELKYQWLHHVWATTNSNAVNIEPWSSNPSSAANTSEMSSTAGPLVMITPAAHRCLLVLKHGKLLSRLKMLWVSSHLPGSTNSGVHECRVDRFWLTVRRSNASALLSVVILSVSLFVHATRAVWRNERTHCRYLNTTWKRNHSSFVTTTAFGRMSPSTWNLHSKWPPVFEQELIRRWDSERTC